MNLYCQTHTMTHLVKSFEEVQSSDIHSLGVENVSYATSGAILNYGLVTTADAYWYFLEANDLFDTLLLNIRNISDLTISEISKKCQSAILEGKVPYNLFRSLTKQYEKLKENGCEAEEVEMWAEIISEKDPSFSFSKNEGMYALVKDWDSLIHHLKVFYASLFDADAMLDHLKSGFRLMDLAVSIRIQPIVQQEEEIYSLIKK